MKIFWVLNSVIFLSFLFHNCQQKQQQFLSLNDPRLQIHEYEHEGKKYIASNYPFTEDQNGELRFIQLKTNNKEKNLNFQKVSRVQNKFGKQIPYQKTISKSQSKKSTDKENDNDRNYCIDSKEINEDTDILDKFIHFVQGPCYPVVMVPGMMGTRLRVRLQCKLLEDDLLETCFRNDRSICQKKPNFNMWFSFSGTIGFLAKTIKNDCFGKLMELSLQEVKEDPSIKKLKSFKKGVKIDWDDEQDISKTECGISAISNLGGRQLANFASGALAGYSVMSNYFKSMGYIPGINLFGMPYDWRQSTIGNGVSEILPKIIKFAGNLNQKKVVLITHSFGSVNTWHMLVKSMSQKEKDELIERFVAIAPPLSGAFGILKHILGGQNILEKKIFGYGMKDFRHLYTSVGGLWQMVIKDYNNQKNQLNQWEDWSQAIQQRLQAEEQFTNILMKKNRTIKWKSFNDPFPWFPHPSRGGRCVYGKYLCGLNFYNYYTRPVAVINGVKYNAHTGEKSIIDLLVENGVRSYDEKKNIYENYNQQRERARILMHLADQDGLQKLPNPNVPVTLIYGAHIKTAVALNSPNNFTEKFNSGEGISFYLQDENYILSEGDQSVSTDSALTPVLKWAYEFDQKVENAYPVHVVEYCSRRQPILRQIKYKGVFFGEYKSVKRIFYKGYAKNMYNGLQCPENNPANHGEMTTDQYIIKFLASIISSGLTDKNKKPVPITDLQIKEFKKYCPFLKKDQQPQSPYPLRYKSYYEILMNQQGIQYSGRQKNNDVPPPFDNQFFIQDYVDTPIMKISQQSSTNRRDLLQAQVENFQQKLPFKRKIDQLNVYQYENKDLVKDEIERKMIKLEVFENQLIKEYALKEEKK